MQKERQVLMTKNIVIDKSTIITSTETVKYLTDRKRADQQFEESKLN